IVRDRAARLPSGSCFCLVLPPGRAPSLLTATTAVFPAVFPYLPDAAAANGGATSRHHHATYRDTAAWTRCHTSWDSHVEDTRTYTCRALVTTTAPTFHNRCRNVATDAVATSGTSAAASRNNTTMAFAKAC